MMFAVMVLVFSVLVLGLSVFANIELSTAGSASPLRAIYASVLTLVGVLGVMIGIALVTLHKRVARLEDKDRHPEESR
jgi:hypothetical protein